MSNLPATPGGRFGPAAPGSPALIPHPFDLPPGPQPPNVFRRVLVTALAVLVAVGIGYGCFRWGSASVSRPSIQAVVVTTRALPAGFRITSADLGSQGIEIPKKHPRDALSPDQAIGAVGKVAPRPCQPAPS